MAVYLNNLIGVVIMSTNTLDDQIKQVQILLQWSCNGKVSRFDYLAEVMLVLSDLEEEAEIETINVFIR